MAFLSPGAYAFSNIFDSYIAGLFKRPTTLMFYASLLDTIGLVILPLLGPLYFLPWAALPWVLLAVFANILYLFPYYHAIRKADTSIVAAMFSLQQILVPLWAFIIIGEICAPLQYVGIGIIIVTSVILNLGGDIKKIKFDKTFWLMVAMALIPSCNATFLKLILRETNWVTAAFWEQLLCFLTIMSFILLKNTRREIVQGFPVYKANFKRYLFIACAEETGSLGSTFALSIIPVLVVSAIEASQPIFVLIYGFILSRLFSRKFRENLTRGQVIKKLICFAFIIVGVVLAIGK